MSVLALFTYEVSPGRMSDFLAKLGEADSPKFASPVMPKSFRMLRSTVPGPMGGLCIVLTVGLAFRTRSDRRVSRLHIVAAVLMVAVALVTRFGNQPINEIVMTWSAQAPAADWSQVATTGGTGTPCAVLLA